jgi:tetratricopeptide (TPR) repeat protein
MRLNLLLVFFLFFSVSASHASADSLLSLLENSKGEKRAEILLELCKKFRAKDTDKALYYCDEATKIYAAAEDKLKELALSYHNTGIVFYMKGEYNTAITYFKKSFVIRDSIGEVDEAANSLNNLGVMHRNLGQLETALKCQVSPHC